MKNNRSIGITSAIIVFASACAHVPPRELDDARMNYARASTGPASELNPAELHTAKEALDLAEAEFKSNPDAQTTKDLAYVADRKALVAEVHAQQAQAVRNKKKAEDAYLAKLTQLQRDTKDELAFTKQELADGDRQHDQDTNALYAERIARLDAEGKTVTAEQRAILAEARTKSLEVSLAKLAAFKEEARGLVLTLSGSVLFVSNKATLLPGAQVKLNQITEALMGSGKRKLLVEGHTDSQGSDSKNMDLSERRADAVRKYIISRGFPKVQIESTGIGETRPIASNNDAEGRANNRRVELVILPM